MKKIITFAAMVAILATAFTFQACNKQAPEANVNPEVRELPASPFQLSALEVRAGHEYPWTISNDGVTNSVKEDNSVLYVTCYNQVTVTVIPDNSGTYSGVNVRSSNPNAVLVEIINANTFVLKRPSIGADGREATIEVWNGNGSVEHKIAFNVKAEQIIHPEFLRFLVDGSPVDVKLYARTDEAAASPSKLLSIPEAEKTKDFITCGPHEVIFQGVYPVNCEYDAIKYQVGHAQGWLNYLENIGLNFNLQWQAPKDPEKYEPLFPYANDFNGKLDDLDGHNKLYLACHPEAMTLASQFVKQTVTLYASSATAYNYHATIYVEYPFSNSKELDEWLAE